MASEAVGPSSPSRRLSPRELPAAGDALFDHGHPQELVTRLGIKRDSALIVSNHFTAAIVVASSDLETALPRRLAERLRSMLPVRILSFPGPPLRFQQKLIWHERTHRDPGAAMFRELVTEVMSRPWRPAIATEDA